MASIKAIRQRITGVSDTRQIVRAMDMVAASKLQRIKPRLEGARVMFNETRRVIDGLRNCHAGASHRYISPGEVKNSAYIVISGDRGLCGSYNSNVSRFALSRVDESPNPGKASVIAIGLQGQEFFQNRGRRVLRGYRDVSDTVIYEDIEKISHIILDMLDKGDVDEVFLVYTGYKTALEHVPLIDRLLPIGTNPDNPLWYDTVIYEPDTASFIERAVPLYMTAYLYYAALESAACEQTARMTSMSAASSSAEEIIEKLTREYNSRRQGMITQEINEITSGARASRRRKVKA